MQQNKIPTNVTHELINQLMQLSIFLFLKYYVEFAITLGNPIVNHPYHPTNKCNGHVIENPHDLLVFQID